MLQRVGLSQLFTVLRHVVAHPWTKDTASHQAVAASYGISLPNTSVSRTAASTLSASGASPGALPRILATPKQHAPLPPSYPTSTEQLFARYEKQGFSQEQVWTAAHEACLGDARFCDNASPYLQRVRNYPISTDKMRRFNSIPKAQRESLKKHLADDMVGLTLRASEHVRIDRGDEAPLQFAQRYAHTRAERTESDGCAWSLREGYTLSSEVAKKDDRPINKHSLNHCANSGYVSVDHTMLAWRSARCDTPLKLEENLVGSCCASLSCADGDKSKARGWRQTQEGVWEYQPVLVTAMDKSFVKHLFELIRSLFGGEKRTERARLAALNSACKSVFPERERTGKAYIVEVNGKRERVFIRPPSIVNVVLSSQANRPTAVREARSDNRDSALTLGGLLVEALKGNGEQNDAETVETFVAASRDPARMQAMLADNDYRDRVASMRPSLRLATEWLHLLLAKTTLDGNELTQRSDPGIELLLLKHLFDEANLAASVGCKSGVDRTPVSCALFSAAQAYEVQHDTPYDPLHATEEQTQQMRESFTRFADAWAKPVVQLTRGINGRIKWDSQPVAKHWYVSAQGTLRFGSESRHGSPRPQSAASA